MSRKKTKFDFSSVRKHAVDYRQIELVLGKAEKSLASSRNISRQDPESAFTLAYESMLKASMALMFSQGYRPRVQLGHHKTLVGFSQFILGEEFTSLTATYERMRKKRNRVVYDIGAVSKVEVKEALVLAEKYLDIVKKKIMEENPQLKLL
jgi:uncharacterized protein (UPF0332 family)